MKSGKTLLEETIDRFSGLGEVFAVMTREQIEQAKQIIPQEKVTYIEEVYPCGTAIAMRLAADYFSPSELILFTAADQMIEESEKLISAISSAIKTAQAGNIVLFGTKPTSDNPQFGYFVLGNNNRVETFIEKPNPSQIAELNKKPNSLWNMGISLMRTDRMIQAWETHFSPQVPSFEESVLSKDKNIYAFATDALFHDVGSFESLGAFYTTQKDSNLIHGDVQTSNVNNCLIYSEELPIKVLEVSDLIIVATSNGILISKKGHSQDQKRLFN